MNRSIEFLFNSHSLVLRNFIKCFNKSDIDFLMTDIYWFNAFLYPLLSIKGRSDTYCILHWAKVLLITYFSKTMA
jgi:hypothetical protein